MIQVDACFVSWTEERRRLECKVYEERLNKAALETGDLFDRRRRGHKQGSGSDPIHQVSPAGRRLLDAHDSLQLSSLLDSILHSSHSFIK